MRTMKKVLAAGLTAVMAMSLMVGCGSKTKETEAATEAAETTAETETETAA